MIEKQPYGIEYMVYSISIWYMVSVRTEQDRTGIWYILLEAQGSYNQAMTEVINHF